ncbi:LacI family DNA-binding transcriptional regulator [Nitrincola alkalisediminis]|uniref:LacI family DNA-binding transcriptional regulator n=1 Tax=Nitrincola alkalisediminis TaxID=1366656 RepID=UPI001FE7FE51|nr:LacI family DNA-binding transcriptional regulator [Nitrincola alkalisediminis]
MGSVSKLTIKDVAKALNVSTATISNAFNRPDQLSIQLRQKIIEQCKLLGYDGPNSGLKNRRNQRSGIVGVLLSDGLSQSMIDPVDSQFLSGVGKVLDQQGYHCLMLQSLDKIDAMQQRSLETLVDGIIVYGMMRRPSSYQRLLTQHKPLVTVDFTLDAFPSVTIDNLTGARNIARHALQHGHQRVAIIGLRVVLDECVCRVTEERVLNLESSFGMQRLMGYQEALQEVGIALSEVPVWSLPENSHRQAYPLVCDILSSLRPTLLLCMSDTIALAAMQAASALGLSVPQDLHIVGFDGIPLDENIRPSLTTVYQQSVEKGQAAARVLLGQKDQQHTVLDTQLLVRESCPYPE